MPAISSSLPMPRGKQFIDRKGHASVSSVAPIMPNGSGEIMGSGKGARARCANSTRSGTSAASCDARANGPPHSAAACGSRSEPRSSGTPPT